MTVALIVALAAAAAVFVVLVVNALRFTSLVKSMLREHARERQLLLNQLLNLAGKPWLPEPYNREYYPEDRITEYRTTALGELGSDDDRPQLLLRQDDQADEQIQAQLNRAIGFGWDQEWDGDEALEQVRRMAVDMGTAA